MDPKVIVTFTPEGMNPPVISADSEQAQAKMDELLKRIQPCLDVADAILKRRSVGSKG